MPEIAVDMPVSRTPDLSVSRTPRSVVERLTSVAKAEFTLLVRNKVTMFSAFVVPLLPFLAMIPMRINGKLDTKTATTFLSLTLAMILISAVFINLLPTFVARREELVLKRLRTGECSDLEILTGIALPVFLISAGLLLATSLATVVGLGQPLPVNALLLLVALVGGCLVFVSLSLLTTLITKNSEASQVTGMPIIMICTLGAGFSPLTFLPEWASQAMQYTPLAPSVELTRLGWRGLTGDGTTVDFAGSFAHAWQPSLILLAWILIGGLMARKYFRWDPRT